MASGTGDAAQAFFGRQERSVPTAFHSILFEGDENGGGRDTPAVPGYFADLNLDQIVAAVTAGKEEYGLEPFYRTPLHDADAVLYRHEVLQDLEQNEVAKAIEAFAVQMRAVRELLAHTKEDYYPHQKERWLLDAADLYVTAVRGLADDLPVRLLQSRGLKAFKKYLDAYTVSKQFMVLAGQTERLKQEVAAIRYEILIEGLRVEVRRYRGEPDYGTEIQRLFKRFSREAAHQYGYDFRDRSDMNQVEAKILDLAAEVCSETFAKLAAYCAEQAHFQDAVIVRFDREVQFYIAYLAQVAELQKQKLPFCYPRVSAAVKEVNAAATFDLALAGKLALNDEVPVTNDFYLTGNERIIVVSGPNQGGKTTFARTFGQLHYLASLGLMVPGSSAQLYLPDHIFTHFEREEKMTNLRGKLEDDLLRMRDILSAATPRSILLINEVFTSTTLHDAVRLSRKIAARVMELDALCVWITFIDEISRLGGQTVSMVSTVVPNRPAKRAFRIIRQPADGLAYALSVAEKYRLTHDMITRRIGR